MQKMINQFIGDSQ